MEKNAELAAAHAQWGRWTNGTGNVGYSRSRTRRPHSPKLFLCWSGRNTSKKIEELSRLESIEILTKLSRLGFETRQVKTRLGLWKSGFETALGNKTDVQYCNTTIMLGFHSNTTVEEEKCRPMDEFSFSILYCAIFIYSPFVTYISYMCLKCV